jgi:hypothetical protein
MANANLTDISRSRHHLVNQFEDLQDGSNAQRLTGQMLVPAHNCWYPPAVDMQDILLVDFDVNHVAEQQEGLYLVEEISGGRITWRGCRRIASSFGRLTLDVSGEQEWMPINSLSSINWRIVGRVEKVYKPR